jgi:ferric-dicitrate binding protein FerR (iron transport regulator)
MSDPDEDMTARLLRLAGPRPDAPADRAARVREAVHARWRTAAARRTVRARRLTAAALLAAAAVTVIAVRVWKQPDAVAPAPAVVAATVERLDGAVEGLAVDGAVHEGTWMATGPSGRAALRLPDGTSMRIDVGSRARLVAPSVVELAAGALYFDTAPGSAALEVRTPLGVARDVGTQFEIRLEPAALRLRVRTGLVELQVGERTVPARPGTELTVAGEAAVSRPIAASGPDWQWAADMAPPFEIDGRPLAAFLAHLAREQGWDLRYEGGLAREASGIMLHGSVRDLSPEDALAVTLRTSGLAHRLQDGELRVFRPDSRQ